MDLVIKNGTVVTASEIMRADVGIKEGKIVALADKIDNGAKSIDATGKYVFPAGVEIHTHLDGILHGMRTVDDWYVSSVGAAFGGTATVVDFPMQGRCQPVNNGALHLALNNRGINDQSTIHCANNPVNRKFSVLTSTNFSNLGNVTTKAMG